MVAISQYSWVIAYEKRVYPEPEAERRNQMPEYTSSNIFRQRLTKAKMEG